MSNDIHLDFKERLYWALRSTKIKKTMLNCHHAMNATGVGSTHGYKLCKALGVDPEGTAFVRKERNCQQEDAELNAIADSRKDQKRIRVNLEDL